MYWLASYPKSGNTWLRMFLGCLEVNKTMVQSSNSPLKQIEKTPIASSRNMLDEALGYSSGNLTCEEIEVLRPLADKYWADERKDWRYRKVHDAYEYLPDGKALLFNQSVQGAVYIIRNPLDVCVSLAHYLGHNNFDKSIEQMADSHFTFCKNKNDQDTQLRQNLHSWSEHVISWTMAEDLPVHVVRYEDMLSTPISAFSKIVKFLNISCSENDIKRSINQNSFDKLQAAERKHGFKESRVSNKPFFREGKSGAWKKVLSVKQHQKVVAAHNKIMERFGYLDL